MDHRYQKGKPAKFIFTFLPLKMRNGVDFTALLEELLDAEEEIEMKKQQNLTAAHRITGDQPNIGAVHNEATAPDMNIQKVHIKQINREESAGSFKVTFVGADTPQVMEYDESEAIVHMLDPNSSKLQRFASSSSISSQKSILKTPSQVVVPDVLPLDPNGAGEFDSEGNCLESSSEIDSSDSSNYGSDQDSSDSDEDNTPLGMRFGGSAQVEPEYATLSMIDEYLVDDTKSTIDNPTGAQMIDKEPSTTIATRNPYFDLQESRTVFPY